MSKDNTDQSTDLYEFISNIKLANDSNTHEVTGFDFATMESMANNYINITVRPGTTHTKYYN